MKMKIFGRNIDEVVEATMLYEYLEDARMLAELMLKAKIAAHKNYILKTNEDIDSLEKQLEKIQN